MRRRTPEDRPRARTRAALAVAAALLCAAPSRGGPPAPAAQADPALARVLEALAEARGAEAAPEDLRDALAALRPPAVEPLFLLHSHGCGALSEPAPPPLAAFQLAPLERRAVAQALALHPEPLRQLLARIAKEEPREGPRRAALELCAEVGEARDVRLLARLAVLPAAPSPGRAVAPGVPPALRAAFRAAADALLARRPEAADLFLQLYADVPPVLSSEIAAALEGSAAPDRLARLAGLLGRVPAVDSQLLSAVLRLARESEPPAPDTVQRDVRVLLGRPERGIVRQALLVLGALEDADAIPELLHLLEDDDPALSSGAHDALRTVAGRDLGDRAARWRRWYEAEMDWWQRRAPACFAALRSGTPAEAAAALAEAGQHRLYRHDLARDVAAGLERRERELVVLTCGILEGLRSPVPRPRLAELARHPDPEVARRAASTLRALEAPPAGASGPGRGRAAAARVPALPPGGGG